MSLMQLLAGVGSAAAGYDIAEDIRGVGEDAAAQMGDLAGALQADTAFKGYGTTTGLGTTTVFADGSTNLGVGPNAGMMQAGSGMYGGANSLFGQAAVLADSSNPYEQQAYSTLTQANNPLFGQAAGGMGTAQGMAMANASNPAYQQAMGAQGGAMAGLGSQQANTLLWPVLELRL